MMLSRLMSKQHHNRSGIPFLRLINQNLLQHVFAQLNTVDVPCVHTRDLIAAADDFFLQV